MVRIFRGCGRGRGGEGGDKGVGGQKRRHESGDVLGGKSSSVENLK